MMRLMRAVLWSLAVACLAGCTSVRVTRPGAPKLPSRVYVVHEQDHDHDHDWRRRPKRRTPDAEPPVVRDPRRGPPDHAPAHGYRRQHADHPQPWADRDDHPGQLPEDDPDHSGPDRDKEPDGAAAKDKVPPGQAKKDDWVPPGQAKKDDKTLPGQAKKDDKSKKHDDDDDD